MRLNKEKQRNQRNKDFFQEDNKIDKPDKIKRRENTNYQYQ